MEEKILMLMRCTLFFVICTIGLLPNVEADQKPNIQRIEDIVYGRKSGMALTLDIFQPETRNECGLVFLVNQGWSSSKSTPNVAAIHQEDFEEYLHRGYTVFAVVTSSQPKFTITEQMEDVHRAVRFIRTNTSQFGVRTDRLGMMGAGSGGQLALMVATQG
ncbi:MAG: alpha/beta hydrolase, partial [Planctomycetes bacterium]|nr:alpha/beta hydrolase [Planctomycetota bacterium]